MCLWLLGFSSAMPGFRFESHAQTAPAPAAPYTLHVYEDLLQLPTLVLNSSQKSYPGLTAAQFSLQLDAGPVFHPRHVRLEGDDPLQIALVFDAGQRYIQDLAQKTEQTAPERLAAWLGPGDHLSVYALDCHLIRSANNLPYSALRLQASLTHALTAADLHKRDPGMSCGAKRRLWDSLAVVVSQLSQLPGRRVILVVSDGFDDTSRTSWNQLARYAGLLNTTFMGLRPLPSESRDGDPANRLPLGAHPTEILLQGNENRLGLLCGETGGLVLPVDPPPLAQGMNTAIELLRHRYILEFARPRNDAAGLHRIDATVPDRHATVLAAGIGFPPRDAAQDTDPGAVPSDPTRAPEVGTRRILGTPQ